MDNVQLSKVLYEIAKPLGYRRKGALFWKTGAELTMLIHLQRSRWDRGVYINFGVTPTVMVLTSLPPSVAYWASQERAECVESPYREMINRLVTDSDDQLPPEEMMETFQWLLTFLEAQYGDTEADRRHIIQEYGQTSCIITDWANRSMKEP